MRVTIALSEPLTNLLEQKAARLQVPVEELATTLLTNALLNDSVDEAELIDNGGHPTLEEIVANIRALPPDPKLVERGEKVGDKAYLDYLLANPPQDTMTFEEWEAFWPQFEQELKALDQPFHRH